MQGLIILGLVWCMLVGFYAWVHWSANAQWPGSFWNTSMAFNPSMKTGIGMQNAARPLALVCYLAVLWWNLPGSMDALSVINGSFEGRRKLVFHGFSIFAGIIFLTFHLMMMFWGYFLE